MTISIKSLESTDHHIWDTYVHNHPEGTVFHLTAWKEVIEKTFGHQSMYLSALRPEPLTLSPEPGGWEASRPESKKKVKPELQTRIQRTTVNGKHPPANVVGILPLFQIKSRLFGNYLVSVPFAEVGGILAENAAVAELLLDEAVKVAGELNCDYLELRHRNAFFELPVKNLYYNFRREIYANIDDNLKAIPRKARRMVRQGEKFGLRSEIGNHLVKEFYEILAKSYHSLGTPIFPLKLFNNLLQKFGDQIQILLIRTKNKIPVAGVLTFFFKDQVLPYYAGSVYEYRNLAPNDFMYWELMRYGCENGYKIFDFGRSKADTGSYHFKRHWGFEPRPLAYQYHLIQAKEIPNLSPSNPKYQKKIELWKKLPFAVTKLLGPPIAKYLT